MPSNVGEQLRFLLRVPVAFSRYVPALCAVKRHRPYHPLKRCPFISVLTYSIGSYFLALSASFEGMGDVSIGYIFDNFSASFEGMEVVSIGYIFDEFLEILMPFLLPMAVGGILVGIASWILVFLSVRMLVSRYRELRIEKRRRKS